MIVKSKKIMSEVVMRLLGCLLGSGFIKVIICLFVLTVPSTAFAAELSLAFKNLEDTGSVLRLLIFIMLPVGISLYALGLWLMLKDGQEKDARHKAKNIIMAIGFLMLILVFCLVCIISIQ